MTVSTSTNSVVYQGNGAATQFAVPFKVLDEDHLRVRRRVFATGVVDYTYVGTDYSYVGIGASSGTLTLAGTALDDDYELVIERIVPYTQDLDIVNAGGFYPETVEEQLDLIMMGIQQLADLVGRGAVVPIGEDGLELSKALDRAGKFFGFDVTGQFVASAGTGNDAALRTDLAAAAGALLVGGAAYGSDAIVRSILTWLREISTPVDGYRNPAADDDTAALVAAVEALYDRGVTVTELSDNPNLGIIDLAARNYYFSGDHLFGRSQYGLTIRGKGANATNIYVDTLTGHGFRFNPSRNVVVTDLSIVNQAGGIEADGTDHTGTSAAISILGTDGAHIFSLERLRLAGFGYGISSTGTTNCDFVTIRQVECGDGRIFYGNHANKNAVAVVLDNVSGGCREAMLELGGAGETGIRNSGFNMFKSGIKYLEGAGVNNIYPQVAFIRDTKIEYSGQTGWNDRLLIDARLCLLAPDGGGADTDTIIDTTTLTLGDNPPADYDAHQIFNFGGGRHRLKMRGSYVRGTVNYTIGHITTMARQVFEDNRAAILPEGYTFAGKAGVPVGEYAHPLVTWNRNDNVPLNQHRGGQAHTGSFGFLEALPLRSSSTLLIATSLPDQQDALDGRVGKDFTFTLPNLGKPGGGFMTLAQMGLYVFIDTAQAANLEVTQYTDDGFGTETAATVTIAAGVTGLFRVHDVLVNITGGEIYVRMTKPAVDQSTVGALILPYFPFLGI